MTVQQNVAFTVRMPPRTKSKLRRMAKARGVSMTGCFETAGRRTPAGWSSPLWLCRAPSRWNRRRCADGDNEAVAHFRQPQRCDRLR